MPVIGLGTWKSNPNEAFTSVDIALQTGYFFLLPASEVSTTAFTVVLVKLIDLFTLCSYTHVDCAHVYKNEHEVGEALKKHLGTTITRDKLWVTSKAPDLFLPSFPLLDDIEIQLDVRTRNGLYGVCAATHQKSLLILNNISYLFVIVVEYGSP